MNKLSTFRTVPGTQKVFCFFIRKRTELSFDVLCTSSCMFGFSTAVPHTGKNYMARTLLFPPHPIWFVLLIVRLPWIPLDNTPLLLPALCCQDNIPSPPLPPPHISQYSSPTTVTIQVWKKLKITSWKTVEALMLEVTSSIIFQSVNEPGYTVKRKKKKPPQWAKAGE